MFVDQAKISVKAGNGGKGCGSFYRDKYTRRGIPDGGDGGNGASVIIMAERNLSTLLDFRYNRHFQGRNGGNGSGKNKRGKDAEDIIIKVPVGTVIKDIETDCILKDLDKDKLEVVVAKGGRGGLGNNHKCDPSDGQPGEERELLLDLKIIADVGVIGFPNVGKSSLISAVSGATPKIANYPFTTKTPVLGVVVHGDKRFIIADIPGLIEGSWQGRGLGDRFLRHVERTKVLLHLVDISGFEGRDPVSDYKIINNELKKYNVQVSKKPQILAANKIDIEGAKVNLKEFKSAVKKKIYPISALNKEGLESLIEAISERL